MHNRQSGAAHVPIMFFLILLVMFLGALGFAYVTQTKNGELIKERNDAREDAAALRRQALIVEHYVTDIGDAIGKFGKYEGRPNGVYGDATLSYPGVMNPAEIKKVLADACTNGGVSVAGSLENVLGALITKINTQNARIKDIETERDKALADKNEADRKFQATASEANAAARTYQQNLEQTRSDFESAKQAKDNNISTLQQSLRSKADELTTAKEEALQREKELKGEIAKHQMHSSALVAQNALRKSPDVADGKVIVARNGIPTAFIGLGRKDMLQPGTVFRVKSPNASAIKGYAMVTKVEEERSEVRLYDFVDAVGDYAREGDLLFNDLYTPRVTRTIYLMGRFTAPYQKEQLTNLLRRLGNKVVDKMAPGVDMVVLGNDPVNEAGDGFAKVEESDEFKLANELRVEFTYLSKIQDLIKL